MLRGRWSAEELASNRNLCGAIFGIAGPCTAVAQALGLPVAVRITLAIISVFGAVLGLAFLLLERRATAQQVPALSGEERHIPRAEFNQPMKFFNRTRELSRLNEVLSRAEAGEGPLVAVLAGMPGVGKSAVGRHWADSVSERFADGGLIAEFSERRRGAAVDVDGFLQEFIRKLGPTDAALPTTTDGLVDRYRSMTADRRLLVLLDDVSDAAEVKQLRPAGKGSIVVATTYHPIEELHYQGAELVSVDPLSPERAKGLLVEMAGEVGRLFEENPTETAELVAFCGGLALPLCVCAARLMMGGGKRTVGSIVAEVADEAQRLSVLAGKGDYEGAAVFGFAYGDLEPSARLIYRRISLHPGLDLAPVHAAILAQVPVADAAVRLSDLADTHLLEPYEDGRFRFHDLVGLHARECAVSEDDEDLRDALLVGLFDWYRAALHCADRAIVRERLRLAPEPPAAPDLPEFSSRSAAFDWLEAERANILAVLLSARDREWYSRGWQIAESLWPFYHNRRHYADWIDATEAGIECAREAGHRDAEARLRSQLSRAFVDLGDFDRAHTELDRSSRALLDSTNLELRGSVREFTGNCYLKEGDHGRALEEFREARSIFAGAKNARGVAIQDYFIGRTLTLTGEYEEALDALESSLETMRVEEDTLFVGRLMLRLGQATLRDGHPDEAESRLQEGLKILTSLGMRLEEAESYEGLAAVAEARRDEATASDQRERALGVYRAIGHPRAGDLAVSRETSPSVGLPS